MLVNFSQEDIVIPKATVVGVAEDISPCVVAAINDKDDRGTSSGSKGANKTRRPVNTVAEAKYSKYLDSALGHLTRKERNVLEPVLNKFRHVFHPDEDAEFKGNGLVEHRIITGDAKPIRNASYRAPYALREGIEGQVRDMMNKGVIEPSFSPWSAPAILVPKKSLDGRPKYRSA
jgi:hypothetical protein